MKDRKRKKNGTVAEGENIKKIKVKLKEIDEKFKSNGGAIK